MNDSLPHNSYLSSWAHSILIGLQGKLVYLGTADPAKVAKQRAKNKVASKQRRMNRVRGA